MPAKSYPLTAGFDYKIMPFKDKEKRKEYARQFSKKYREANKEKVIQYFREYREKNREKVRQWVRNWEKLNKKRRKQLRERRRGKILLYQKEYRQKYPEKIKERARWWREKNKEKVKECHKVYSRKNKEKIKIYQKSWYFKNKERIKNYQKKWRGENIELVRRWNREWQRNEKRENVKYRLDCNLGTAIYTALKSKKNGRSWETLVGYNLEDLIKHLQNQFDEKMNWNNYGNFWVIDHIKPKSLFHYEKPEDEEFKKCWALKNLQPLEKIKNNIKYNKYLIVK